MLSRVEVSPLQESDLTMLSLIKMSHTEFVC